MKIYMVENPKAFIGYFIVKADSEGEAKREVINWFETSPKTRGHIEWYEEVHAKEVIFAGNVCDDWSVLE